MISSRSNSENQNYGDHYEQIFQKFLQSVIDLSSVRARCCEDNTHDIDMNPDAEAPIPEWKVYFDGNFWEPSGKDRCRNRNPIG